MTNDLTKEELEEIARTGTASLRPWQMQVMAKQLLGFMEQEARMGCALTFYANKASYHKGHCKSDIEIDKGEIARKALSSGPIDGETK